VRRMSFALTTGAVRARTKTVTRRLGWKFAKAGDRILAVDKLRTKNAQKLGVIEIVDVRREPLDAITYADVARERVNLPDCSKHGPEVAANCVYCFIGMFCRSMKCEPETIVTRIEFRYVEESA
jgi:hypothetical protein